MTHSRWAFLVMAAMLSASAAAPVAARQVTAVAADTLLPPWPPLQASSGTFGRAGTGFGAGVTLGAVAMSAALVSGDGNACTGSGDYLEVCRIIFVGGTALAGGLGAVIGALTRRDTPSGRARPVLLGSAAGALVPFLLSLAACEQGEPTNPALLCGSHGMVNPGITTAAAAGGGLIGYLLGGSAESRGVVYLGPVTGPGGAPAMGVAFSKAW